MTEVKQGKAMVDTTKAVSIRLPVDLLKSLSDYATDKGLVRGGESNIGGSIISILKEYFYDVSDNVNQKSDNTSIEILNSLIDERFKELEDRTQATITDALKSFRGEVDSLKKPLKLVEKKPA